MTTTLLAITRFPLVTTSGLPLWVRSQAWPFHVHSALAEGYVTDTWVVFSPRWAGSPYAKTVRGACSLWLRASPAASRVRLDANTLCGAGRPDSRWKYCGELSHEIN